jgi:hypothetical protein
MWIRTINGIEFLPVKQTIQGFWIVDEHLVIDKNMIK